VYIHESDRLGDFPRGQCPPVAGDDIKLIVKSFGDRLDYSVKKRINSVTDVVFIRRHPERWDNNQLKIIKLPRLSGASVADQKLIQEWGHLRDCLVIPVHRIWAKV